jgi:hypothetical protein
MRLMMVDEDAMVDDKEDDVLSSDDPRNILDDIFS